MARMSLRAGQRPARQSPSVACLPGSAFVGILAAVRHVNSDRRQAGGVTRSERRPATMLYVKETSGSAQEVVERIEKAAADNKFGVLGVHNLKERMRAKG